MSGTISYGSYTDADLTEFANQVKDQLALKTGHNLDDYVVVVSEPKSLGRFIKSIFKKPTKGSAVFVFKVLDRDTPQESE